MSMGPACVADGAEGMGRWREGLSARGMGPGAAADARVGAIPRLMGGCRRQLVLEVLSMMLLMSWCTLVPPQVGHLMGPDSRSCKDRDSMKVPWQLRHSNS